MPIAPMSPAVLSLLPQAFTLNQPAPGVPVLTEARITFFTYDGGNDKDANSRLRISFYADYGNGYVMQIADRDWEAYGLFDDRNGGSVNPIDPLNVHGVLPVTALGNARLKLEFEPKGDDTWKFHYQLRLTFDNGMVLTRDGRDKELSDGSRLLIE